MRKLHACNDNFCMHIVSIMRRKAVFTFCVNVNTHAHTSVMGAVPHTYAYAYANCTRMYTHADVKNVGVWSI